MNRSLHTLAASSLIAAVSATMACAAEPVSGDALRSAIAGKTVHVSTPVGSVPVKFRADGTMSASAGGVMSFAVAGTDTGRWWVAGDRLCSQWSQWFKQSTMCVRMRKDGQTLHWTGAGRSGTAVIAGGR